MLRCSNWETRPLCPEQQEYAALDAVASLRLYEASHCRACNLSSLIARRMHVVRIA